MESSNQLSQQQRLAAPCGSYCAACEALVQERCNGCPGRFAETGAAACPVLHCCAVERGLEHCGLCLDFACQLYLAHSDPLVVARHYRALCRRTAIGTARWLGEQQGRYQAPGTARLGGAGAKGWET